MVVGQFVTKQTWLLDEVEICGTVSFPGLAAGDELGAQSEFNVVPDEGYRHLVALIPGSKGMMHCETYPLPTEHVNRDQWWPLPDKDPSAVFLVRDPATGTQRALKAGDHVRVVGRWTIDHHPDQCVTRYRGLLRVGCAWPEFHPFRWNDVSLVTLPPASGEEKATLSLAAPIHEEVYLRDGKWLANEIAGVASKVFVTDDGSNYHNTVSATLRVRTPPLPAGWSAVAELVSLKETIIVNASGLDLESVRSLTVSADAVQVSASISAPATVNLGWGLVVGDVNDPANGRSIFQARYAVGWRPRLAAPPVTVTLPTAATDSFFAIAVQNMGPDPVTITSASLQVGDPHAFSVTSNLPLLVPGHGQVTLQGRFTPPVSGHYVGKIAINSDDPCGKGLLVAVDGRTGDTSGSLEVRVDPASIQLGTSTGVTIVAVDSGSTTAVAGTARVMNYTATGKESSFEVSANQAFTRTFWQQKEYDGESGQWIYGELPSGMLTVPGYNQGADVVIPFHFTP